MTDPDRTQPAHGAPQQPFGGQPQQPSGFPGQQPYGFGPVQQPYGLAPQQLGRPGTLSAAVILMYIGGGLELLGFGLSVAVNSATAFGALIGGGLWFWMAAANRRGRRSARVTGTVFFGIDCLLLIGVITVASQAGSAVAAGIVVVSALVQWLIGLAAVILMWNRASGAYYNAMSGTRF
jgi:hypothetical protein